MGHRHAIPDADRARAEGLLPGRPGQNGRVGRQFLDAVLRVARTGAAWRDLPERLGEWNTRWRRSDRWARRGVRGRVFAALRDPDAEWLLLDSAAIRARPCAAGASEKAAGRRPGRSAAAGAGSARRPTPP